MTPEQAKIDLLMMRVARQSAAYSPDNDRHVGACLVVENGARFLAACNTFPNGVTATAERRRRPTKYRYIEHAEINVLFQAINQGASVQGSTLYVTLYPCCTCARAVIALGVSRICILGDPPNFWGDDADRYGFRATQEMFSETGVVVSYVPEMTDEEALASPEEWATSMALTGENYD